MDSLTSDVRHAARSLLRAPAFAAVVVLLLAIGIGANTAVFSLVSSALLRPLDFVEPQRLVALYEGAEGAFDRTPFSPPDLLDVQRDQQSFEGVGAYRNLPFEISADGEAERVVGAKVSANIFAVLGVTPFLGRTFGASEDSPGNDLAVISSELWQRRYGGSTAVIGQSIQLDRRPYTIVGVMPASFRFPLRGGPANNQPADVWVPMAFTDREAMERGSMFSHSVVARLKPGVSVTAAQAELDALTPRIMQSYPPVLRNTAFAERLKLLARPLQDEIAGPVKAPLLMLFAAMGLVLIVACSNVANLVLSRAASRERDVSIRAALGASQLRILQRQIVEAVLLTLIGGALGLVFAHWMLALVPAVVAGSVPGFEAASLSLEVLAFAGVASLAAGAGFGVLPSLLRGGSLAALREGGTRATPRRHRIQSGLIVSTVALACMLLVGAGLFLRSFTALLATDPGFRAAGVLSVSLALPQQGYPTAASVRTFHESLRSRAAAVPGVQSAAVATDLPLESYEIRMFTPERQESDGTGIASTQLSWVHGAYFETLGFTLRQGRFFSGDEHNEDRRVVVVNESLADRFWPAGNAVGQRIKWGPPEGPAPWLTIVGIVSDVAGEQTVSARMDADRPIRAYEPFRQFPDFFLDNAVSGFGRDVRLAVRTTADPSTFIDPLRRELASIDPALAIVRIAEMNEVLRDTVAPQRFSTVLLTTFAGAALLLVATGLYGLLAFTVEQRRREIGVRVALGAQPWELVRMILGKGVKLVGIGVVIGISASAAEVRLLEAFLYRTDAYDATTIAAVTLVLFVVALLAAALPAYRAARVDPMQALRND